MKRLSSVRSLLTSAVFAAFAAVGFADGEPAGETLGEFCYQTRTGVVVTVDVAADAVRVLDAMPYGRGSGTKIIKTGPGKLVIKDLRNYPGQVIVEAGAVRLGDIDEPAAESEVCDIQNLSLANGTEVEVAAGKTARIAGIDFTTRFVKSGDGTLEIVNTANKKLLNVRLAGGRIVFVNEPTVSALAQLAAGPSLHLDANDTDKMTFTSAGSKTVAKWYDAKGADYVERQEGSPTLVVGATTNQTTQTPLNAVSFGGFRSQARANLSRAVHGVRTAFVVAAKGSSNQIGMLLGTAPSYCLVPSTSPDTSNDIADFKYGNDSNGWPSYAFRADTSHYTVRYNCGTTRYYYDGATGATPSGETTSPNQIPVPNSTTNFILHEVRIPVGAHVSSLGSFGKNYLYSGGWRYGEIILYERALTDRERIATRNYLAKKWLGRSDAELTPLPAAPADPDPFVLPDYQAEDGGSLTVGTGDSFHITRFSGEGAFTKDGAGTLAVQDFVGYTGTVTVAAGTLRLTGERPPYEPIDPAALKPAVHFDADAASSFTYSDPTTRKLSAWASKNDAGVSAKKKLNSIAASDQLYVKTATELGGKDYVYFADYTGAHFRDDATGGTNTYSVKTMITFVGSQRGGGMLMGGTDTRDPFFRGPNDYGGSASDPIVWGGSNMTEPTRRGEFYLNFERLATSESDYGQAGARSPASVGLSGGWDLVGYRASESSAENRKVICQGLAYESDPTHIRDGKQNLAEIAVWTNLLTVADVQGMGAYLKIKWNQELTWERSRANGLSLHLAEGATLDLGGRTQYLESLTGAGTVVNGSLCLAQFALDATAEPQTLPYALDFSGTKRITVANALSAPIGKTTLLTATSVAGTLDGVEIVGFDGFPPTIAATVAIEGNALVLTVAQKAYVRTLAPTDGSSVPVIAALTTAVDYVVGEGAFTKTGAGVLAAKDVVGYTGTVTVAEGTLKLAGVRPKYEPAMPDETGLVLHLDASDAASLTLTDYAGTKRVSEWRSKTPNGWRVTPTATSEGEYPVFAADTGLRDGAGSVRIGYSKGMWFRDADGNKVITTNIQSVLWILGSQDGGGFLLGTSVLYNGKKSHFFRGDHGGDYGGSPNDYIFYVGAHDSARTMEMYLNDRRLCESSYWGPVSADTPRNTGLTGGWDFISGRVSAAYQLAADSLAYNPDTASRCGRQRLAELLIFERRLTADEAFQAGAALRVKWGLEPDWQRSRVNAFDVNVATGAILDLGGTNQYVKSLGGAGLVTNGTVLVEALAFDALAPSALDIAATLDLAETKTIAVTNVAQAPIGKTTLQSATAIAGTLDGITVTGLTEGMPQTRTATLAIEDDALVLTVAQVPYLEVLEPADGETVNVPGGELTAANYVVGAGSFSKDGTGTLALKDLVGYTGTVAVAEGTLKLTGVLPPFEPADPATREPVLHFDADAAESFSYISEPDRTLSAWASKNGAGVSAKRKGNCLGGTITVRSAAELGGKDYVDFVNHTGAHFRDDATGVTNSYTVRSMVMLVGSERGGGMLFGSATDSFFRGKPNYGGGASDALLWDETGATEAIRHGEFYLNLERLANEISGYGVHGARDPAKVGLSGGWDVVAFRAYGSKLSSYNPVVQGLAYESIPGHYRDGKQNMAEVAIWTNVLAAADLQSMAAYLKLKWNQEPTWQRSQTNAFAVIVGADATLDLGGTNAYLRAIGGAGAVTNGNVTAAGLVASADGALSLEGTFTATDAFTVDLSALPTGLAGEITILTAAGGFVNPDAIRRTQVLGGYYPYARAYVRGNAVVVRLQKRGMAIIFR